MRLSQKKCLPKYPKVPQQKWLLKFHLVESFRVISLGENEHLLQARKTICTYTPRIRYSDTLGNNQKLNLDIFEGEKGHFFNRFRGGNLERTCQV